MNKSLLLNGHKGEHHPMRKGFSLLLILTLAVTSVQSSSAANPKAGTTCTKLGSKQTYSGKVFTCVKSGKKLVWNKGVTSNATASKSAQNSSGTNQGTPASNESASNENLLEKPCVKSGEVKTTNFTWVCINDKSKGLIWVRKGAETLYQIVNSASNSSLDTVDKQEPLLEKPCPKAREEKQAGFLLVCFKDRSRGLIWIRKGTNFLYKLEGEPVTLINRSDIWNSVSTSTVPDRLNPLMPIPALNGAQAGPTDIKQCKLKDMHDPYGPGDGPMAHGFPVTPMNPKYVTNGVLKIGILPVDFTDVAGESTLKADLAKNIALMEDWFKYYSNGKLKLEITKSDTWIHSNQTSASFDWATSYPNTGWRESAPKIGQRFVDLAPSNFDFSQLGALLVYFPQKNNNFNTDLSLESLEYNTKQGKQFIAVEAPPNILYMRGQQPWAFWIHELLHGIGIAGHAPSGEEGMPLGIMINQLLGSFAMTAWDQFILEWLPDNQVYCIAPSQVNGQIISLSPMEREDSVTKTVIIPLTESTGIVLQANRDNKWASKQDSYTFPDKFSGVIAYLVDTANGNFRSKESAYGTDIPEYAGIIPDDVDPQELFFANFIKIDGGPTRTFACPAGLEQKPGEQNLKGGGCWQWNALTHVVAGVGDSFTIAGIKIQVIGSLENETVRLTKVG